MPDNVIALLPDHVANQIAAGEVVQRPASVVKELLENAIDAGATTLKLIIRDAGRSLIQLVDNGKGMNPLDARMCFERHATSKINSADDLFKLTTKGFRGEALASIAAVAQVEMKTKQESDLVGQQVIIEGGSFISQEECQTATGTTFTVKNLFYNIPARRNFLKNDNIEQKHIIDEVERVAIPHSNIHFIVQSNGNEIINLPPGTLIQRIKSLLGGYIQKELVSIAESTPYLNVSGYVSLPEAAVKTKRDQYFFVNNRFIKNTFLNYAIYDAYKELIGYQSHPKYFIFLELDPKTIDINIHPTKTEIKFSDERTVYMLLQSAVKRALGKANAAPSLDFETESSLTSTANPDKIYTQPKVSYNTSFNPFHSDKSGGDVLQKVNRQNWENLFEGFRSGVQPTPTEEENQQSIEQVKKESIDFKVFQLNNKYLVTTYNQTVLVVDQQRAHERIVYEHYLHARADNRISSQQLLFPEQIELSSNDFSLIRSVMEEFRLLGFDMEIFGKSSIVINGTPSDMQDFNVRETVEGILETFKLNTIDVKVEKRDNLCRSIAKNISIKYGKSLEPEEMQLLLNHLMQCENPLYTANGKVVMMELEYPEIEKFFRK